MTVALDALDRKILAALQEDATQPLEALAAALGASKTPVWNRIRKLKRAGVIRATTARVDPAAVGLEICFFVMVKTARHEADWLARFEEIVRTRPEILEAHRLAGEVDYLLKVRVDWVGAYDRFYQGLIGYISFHALSSALSMETMKEETALPIAPAPAG